MQTFEQLLDARYLTASFRDTPTLTDFFFTGRFFTNTRDVPTDEWELINYAAANSPMPVNSVGSPANLHTVQAGQKRLANMFYTYNGLPLPAHVLQALRESESMTLQRKGMETVEMMQEEFQHRHRVLKEAVIASIFAFGRVDFDVNGNVLRPAVDSLSGALTAPSGSLSNADYTVANSHRGNLGGIIGTMWSSSSTRIVDHLEDIRYQASIAGVPRPTEIIVHELSKKHLRDNAQFQLWAKESNVAPDTILRGEMIEGLWGYNWHFVGGTYQDSNGSTVDLVPQTHAIIVPPNGPWFRAVNGLELVPREIGLTTDLMASLNGLDEVYGEFSYASLEHNPARLTLFMGDKYGFAFPNPNAIWMPNVFETDDVSGDGGQSGTGA